MLSKCPQEAWACTPVLVNAGSEQPYLLELTAHAQILDFKNKILLIQYLRL